MLSKRVVLVLSCVFALLILCSYSAWGQTAGTGQVVGTVTDPTGAAIAGATITLTDTATNSTRTTTANEGGRYIFPNVVPGKYNIAINKAGFRQAKFGNQEVVVGESRTFDAKMQLGATSESIEVVAANTDLQTMNATVGNTITGVALENLPGLGRDVSTFVSLQPGVAPDGSVAGANQDQNSFQLDGGNNSSDMDGTQNTYTPSFAGDPSGGVVNSYVTVTAVSGAPGGGGPSGVMPTPVDSIEEFTVGTTNQTADFNSSAGAQVQMVTKRGTNGWHGAAYEYYLDNNWDANTFDNNASVPRTPNPSYHYNRFGGSVGGPVIPKEILGGKWFIFANYEGFRFPNSTTVTRAVPSDGMKLGLLQFGGTVYNLNPGAVTYPTTAAAMGALVPGTTYPGSGTTLDPRGLGISPTIQAMWKYMPESNQGTACLGLSRCDGLNVLAFKGQAALPWKDNFGVLRLDHDFGSKWHFYSTYRYYHMQRATNDQVDIGGFFPGDKLGVPASISNRPQVPWYLTISLSTNITSNVTNNFHYSYLRNFWGRASGAQPPQVPGLGGAIEPFGENRTFVLAPYNLNTQSVRTRFWDGKDNMIRDDVSWLKGKHFFQFGGIYQHNWDYHQRTDNGGGINYQTVYAMGAGAGSGGTNGMNMTGYVPAGLGSSWSRDYAIVLGIPSLTQIAYTRTGSNLNLNPPNTPANDQSTIPFYNLYFSDSWRMKPSFTLTYGLGWTLEMPPVENKGKQIVLVDANDKAIDTMAYLNAREKAALAGQAYNPEVGFTLVGNVAGHPKYPYNPFYKSFSPHIAAAWNPSFDSGLLGKLFGHNKSVIRGGYGILYGRLNGVDLVLVPLLGTGLIQAVQCFGPLMDGTCSGGTGTPANAFRIGPTAGGFDGLVAPLPAASQTLPQPDFPGVNALAAGAGSGLDPNFRPSMSQQFDLTVQRQINSKISVEFGYIGRKITHEFQPININAVPYMMTLGGQSFAKAYGQMVWQYCGGNAGLAGGGCAGNLAAVTEQPFFKAALHPAYCAGFASCAQAVAAKEGNAGTGNIQQDNLWSLWSDLDNGNFNFPRTMMNTPINCPTGTEVGCNGQLTSGVGMNASVGWGNYNAGFITLKVSQWHDLTLQSNFTYGKALGTGSEVQATSQFTVPDAYNLHAAYGLQPWDRKFLFNTFLVYQPPFYKNQHGLVGRLAGGWSFAPIITVGSGLPLEVQPADAFANEIYGGGQAFGEGEGSNFAALQNAIRICPNNFGSSRHNHPVPSALGLGSNFFGPSMFQNPDYSYSCFRNPILGIDSSDGGGAGILRGMPFWNVDFSVKKSVLVTERVNVEFTTIFSNLFNHNQLSDPYLILGDTGDWGAAGGFSAAYNGLTAQVNNPRAIEFGLRIRF
ncbi:MAG: carboxypeptidase-like regulatory domain-containing protein [Candidatus Acidiferrum sp.]